MSDRNKNRERFLRYLRDQLTGKEKNRFEKEMERDPFEKEAFEGYQEMNEEEIVKDLSELDSNLQKRVKGSNRGLYLRIAATVAIILVISTVFFTLFDREIDEIEKNPEVSETMDTEPEEPEKAEPDRIKEGIGTKDIPPAENEEDTAGEKPQAERDVASEEIISPEEADTEPAQSDPEGKKVKEPVGAPVRAESIAELPEEKTDETTPLEKEAQAARARLSEEVPTVRKSMSAAVKGSIPAQNVMPDEISARTGIDTVRGKVLSAEDQMPLPGVVIRRKGSDEGTVTDVEGRFSLPVAETDSLELMANFIGMEEKSIRVNDEMDVNIVLEPSALALEEVVVTGYNKSEEAVDPTGSVSIVKNLDNTVENDYKGAYPREGYNKFREYISENMIFPESELDKAVVVLTFTVSPEGRPVNIEVKKSPGESFSSEAIRLLREGPEWVPAENNGKYIADEKRIRIVFKND